MDRQATAMLIVTGVARALGGEADMADPVRARADFDAALRAEPEQVDEDKAALLDALGLRRYRGGHGR